MKTTEKIKKIILIASGFAFATYLIISGMAILDKEEIDNNLSVKTK